MKTKANCRPMNYLEPHLTCDIPQKNWMCYYCILFSTSKKSTGEIVRLFGASNCAFKIVRYFTDNIPF